MATHNPKPTRSDAEDGRSFMAGVAIFDEMRRRVIERCGDR
jgi:hypothetical protein